MEQQFKELFTPPLTQVEISAGIGDHFLFFTFGAKFQILSEEHFQNLDGRQSIEQGYITLVVCLIGDSNPIVTFHSRCEYSLTKSATLFTGISRSINAILKASNSKVKPLPFRIQGNFYGLYFPFRCFDSGYLTAQITFMLKKVQMSSCSLWPIVDFALWDKHMKLGVINLDMQRFSFICSFFKSDIGDIPRSW